jgi:hypothetical protein
MGRRSIFKKPLTPAQRQRRWRIKKRKNEIASGIRPARKRALTPTQRQRRWRNKKRVPTNNFNMGSGPEGKHYWLTPPELYERLNKEFHFDFDPCPWPLPDGFDGLACEWGRSNFVNPPFGAAIHRGRKTGPTAWARKCLEEYKRGKTVVLVYPLDKWLVGLLTELLGGDVRIRNLGDVRWRAIEDGSPGPGTGAHIACFVLKLQSVA